MMEEFRKKRKRPWPNIISQHAVGEVEETLEKPQSWQLISWPTFELE
jgi:hypothetical protein